MVFLDWTDGVLIRRIDVVPKAVYWNETGEIVLIACDESFFVLKYNKVRIARTAIATGTGLLSDKLCIHGRGNTFPGLVNYPYSDAYLTQCLVVCVWLLGLQEAVAAAIANGAVGEEGVEEAFELLHELADKVQQHSPPPHIAAATSMPPHPASQPMQGAVR